MFDTRSFLGDKAFRVAVFQDNVSGLPLYTFGCYSKFFEFNKIKTNARLEQHNSGLIKEIPRGEFDSGFHYKDVTKVYFLRFLF